MSNRAFKILMDERYWTVDDNNVLYSVICLIDEKKVDVPVVWDEKGAYIEHYGIKEYVLVNTVYDMTDYQKGKIDGVKEFTKELKNHSCSYDLEEWMDFDAVNVDVIDKLMNEYVNKILAESTESEE